MSEQPVNRPLGLGCPYVEGTRQRNTPLRFETRIEGRDEGADGVHL